MTTIELWKKLQQNGYFKKHRLYKTFDYSVADWSCYKDKVVAEIGCGYGRETVPIAKEAKKVYAIDVVEDLGVCFKDLYVWKRKIGYAVFFRVGLFETEHKRSC